MLASATKGQSRERLSRVCWTEALGRRAWERSQGLGGGWEKDGVMRGGLGLEG